MFVSVGCPGWGEIEPVLMVLEACWFERPDVSHEQADARIGRQARPQVTDAEGGCELAASAAPTAGLPRARNGLALRARRTVEAGDGVKHRRMRID